MSNFDTVNAITGNIHGILKTTGINFTQKVFDDREVVPASLLPLGEVYYAGERFESAYGQRPLYAEAEYNIRVLVSGRDPEDLVREIQRWAHTVKEALTVDALNTGPLAQAKPVSRVTVARADSENNRAVSSLSLRLVVRYREV